MNRTEALKIVLGIAIDHSITYIDAHGNVQLEAEMAKQVTALYIVAEMLDEEPGTVKYLLKTGHAF